MRIGTLAAGLVLAGGLVVGAGCSHEQRAAGGAAPNTMSLAQGDKVGRALLAPTAAVAAAKVHQQTEVADTSAESGPVD